MLLSNAASISLPLLIKSNTLSFNQVYKETFSTVWRLVKRKGVHESSIDDVTQETFINVNKRLSGFEHRSNIKTWVCGIALNTIHNYHRTKRRKGAGLASVSIVGDPNDLVDTIYNQYDNATNAQASQIVKSILSKMDNDKAEIFALVELEGLIVPEASEILKINENTLYARLKVARIQFEHFSQKFKI